MNVEVDLFASLARYKPKTAGTNSWIVVCPEGTTINTLLRQLNVPRKEVKLIFLNSIHVKDEQTISDEDRVGVFPPVGGG